MLAEVVQKLQSNAMIISQQYHGEIFLVGSVLNNRHPRDIDVRLVLPLEKFSKEFGASVQWWKEGQTGNWTDVRWKWSRLCVNLAGFLSHITDLNIDFQIYPEGHLKGERLMIARPPCV